MHITARSGNCKGIAWAIKDRGLTVGRDHACDVVLSDPTVSRFHCRLAHNGERLMLEDMGSSNLTLVDGEPVRQHLLRPGDEFHVGRIAFLVASKPPVSSTRPRVQPVETTITLADNTPVYLPGVGLDALADTQRLPVADVQSLLVLARRLLCCQSMNQIAGLVEEALRKRLRLGGFWLALTAKEPERYNYLKACWMEAKGLEFKPDILLAKALEENRGFIVPRRVKDETGKRRLTTTMAVPIKTQGLPLGGLVAQACMPEAVLDEGDLHYATVLAEFAGPLMLAMEQTHNLRRENVLLRHAHGPSVQLVGESRAIKQLTATIEVVAPSDTHILITGATGTGKEVVANLIHAYSGRNQGGFVAINCAAVSNELLCSELFGHEKGAFTGAVGKKTGLIEQCRGGTLFLDEIGEMNLDNQAQLLRVIETKRFRRVGGQEEIAVDFRVVAATNRNPQEQISQGLLRPDLYHRLRGVELHVPPLTERVGDIPLLARHFLTLLCHEQGLHPIRELTPNAVAFLKTYHWPGNVRELRAAIEAALLFARGPAIDKPDLEFVLNATQAKGRPPTLAENERRLIEDALDYCQGNVVRAAKTLGVSKDTLYRRLARYKRQEGRRSS